MAAGTIEVLLDKPRNLRFDVNALADIEQKCGTGISSFLSEEKLGFNAIRLLLWGGLKWEDRRMSVDLAGLLVQQAIEAGQGLEMIGEKITDAINVSGLFTEDESGKVDGAE